MESFGINWLRLNKSQISSLYKKFVQLLLSFSRWDQLWSVPKWSDKAAPTVVTKLKNSFVVNFNLLWQIYIYLALKIQKKLGNKVENKLLQLVTGHLHQL